MMTTVTTPYLPDAHDRVQRDLIESEREQRRTAETLARDLAKVLQELAILLDGTRLESLRRLDPRVPQYWTPEDWRQFFAKVPNPTTGGGWGQGEGQRVNELERTIAELKKRLADTEALLTTPAADAKSVLQASRPTAERLMVPCQDELARPKASTSSRPSPAPAPFGIPLEMVSPLGNLLAKSREIWNLLPVTSPAAFSSSLSGKGRTGEDLKKAYRRYWLSLYLIGTFRLNATLEIEDLMAMTGGLSSRAGSLGRIVDDLVDGGILFSEILRIGSPRTSLRLVKLSPEGVRLFKILFNREPVESDWERLIKNHEGERFLEHTLAILIFAMHARKRGWATQILSPVENTKAVPDLLVLKGGEKWYVEVELGQKENPAKWRNQARLNGGKVALCATTPDARQRLAGDCRLARLSGQATDLETLIKAKYGNITDQTELWAESW